MNDHPLIRVEKRDYLDNAVFTKLEEHYDGLSIDSSSDSDHIIMHVNQLDNQQRINLQCDVLFKCVNPSLPLENLCSRLDNYNPKTSSQEEMLYFAKQLIGLDMSHEAAGLFMHGDTGVGKTHIAVGITKEFMKKGSKVYFADASRVPYGLERTLGPGQTWVLDDLNSPYISGMHLFKRMILNAHDQGGRIFVTSNTPFEYLIENGFTTDHEQKPRVMDRIQGMFKVLHISGESARKAKTWHAGMEFTPLQNLQIDLAAAVQKEDFTEAARIRDKIQELT